ncbi:hypothetical protein N9E79_00930 [bacterium]|nr:hypothetical protein [bacterium]
MIILTTSWNCFSQIDTNKISDTTKVSSDTTKVVLSYNVAKLVAKDLIAGDSCKKEVELLNLKTLMILERERQKDSTILLLNKKSMNFETILVKKDEQFNQYEELNLGLIKELKIEKRKTGLYKTVSIVGGVIIGILLINNN